MARIKSLRLARDWSQQQMADYLHCAQATVARMEAGQAESGAVSVLLDQLAETIGPVRRDNDRSSAAVHLDRGAAA